MVSERAAVSSRRANISPWRTYAVTVDDGRQVRVRHGDVVWGRWSSRIEPLP